MLDAVCDAAAFGGCAVFGDEHAAAENAVAVSRAVARPRYAVEWADTVADLSKTDMAPT
jgi:hypothetical protein